LIPFFLIFFFNAIYMIEPTKSAQTKPIPSQTKAAEIVQSQTKVARTNQSQAKTASGTEEVRTN
jgi:hypothetical protein